MQGVVFLPIWLIIETRMHFVDAYWSREFNSKFDIFLFWFIYLR